jgi:hypothetical protein
MKTRNLLLILTALLALAVFAPRVQAQAGTETIQVIDSSCVIAAPCTLQLYREVLPSGQSSCPAPGAAGATYAALTTTTLGTSVGIVNTGWTYVDSTIIAGTTFCYYATVTYSSGGPASAPSGTIVATIPAQIPAAPTMSGTYQPGA